jgi:galactokinase
VNLVEQAHAAAFIEHLRDGYRAATGIDADIYRCHASAGAHRLSD